MEGPILMRSSVAILLLFLGACADGNPARDAIDGQAKAPPTTTAPSEATMYDCPMHPEVTSDQPGKCPKCGMDLVKKEP